MRRSRPPKRSSGHGGKGCSADSYCPGDALTPGEMVVLLLLAVLFLAAMVGAMVLVFFRLWRILRDERDQHQNLESAATEPRESRKSVTEGPGEVEEEVPPDDLDHHKQHRARHHDEYDREGHRPWWRRLFG